MPPRMPYTAARALYRGAMMRNLQTMRHASSKASKKPAPPKPLPYQAPQSRPQAQAQGQQHQAKDNKLPLADLVRERWFAIFGFGSAILCLGYFTASLTMYWRQQPATCYPVGLEPETPTGRPLIQSPYEFDLHLDKSEWRFGITRLRRELGAEVRGHVLEVAIGTGRNFEFYDWRVVTASLATPAERAKIAKALQADDSPILSFTGVDISPGMLDIALQRLRQVVPHMVEQIPKKPSFAILAAAAAREKQQRQQQQHQGHMVSFLDDKIRLLQLDVQDSLPAAPPLSTSTNPQTAAPQKYDTILQSFGLCSVRDPVSLISLMASSLQPNTGRILLLEHGRSIWDLVNGLLDRGARGHHERFGCWWNRDIELIVTAAAQRVPGLEIVRLERPGWVTAGTHVVAELRVKDTSTSPDATPPPGEEKRTGWASVLPSILTTTTKDAKKSG
ncbi:hypothetical protein GGS21DRAFT_513059 [Xylaria nigripes]|nr:hypothetical protein GGS21DRAFT_513059 [Xylaria nigripes]